MAVSFYASVVVDGEVAHASFEFAPEGLATVRDVFDRADREGTLGDRFFARLLGWRRRGAVTVLHNGRRLKLPKDLKSPVTDGDDVSALTPVVGG
jgi:hypothetical protein